MLDSPRRRSGSCTMGDARRRDYRLRQELWDMSHVRDDRRESVIWNFGHHEHCCCYEARSTKNEAFRGRAPSYSEASHGRPVAAATQSVQEPAPGYQHPWLSNGNKKADKVILGKKYSTSRRGIQSSASRTTSVNGIGAASKSMNNHNLM